MNVISKSFFILLLGSSLLFLEEQFKLLLIQLGLPSTFSLANILNKQESKNSKTSGAGENANLDF